MSHRAESVLIVGIGNELLCDEGLGVHVARALLAARGTLPAGVAVLEAGTSLLEIMAEMSHYAHVVIVDAIYAGGEAGTLYRAELSREASGQLETLPAISLHEWGLLDTLRAAKMLGLLPGRLTLIGAEPERIQPGLGLSPKLARAEDRIVTMLLDELGTRQAEFREQKPAAEHPA